MTSNAPHRSLAPGRIPLFAWAYALGVAVAVVAWTLPAAVVTTSPGQLVQETEATHLAQTLVLVSLVIAIAGRTVRVLRPLALVLAVLLAILGGALGAFGTELLIEMHDFEASGRAGSGAWVVGLAGLVTVVAVALDTVNGVSSRRTRGSDGSSEAVTGSVFVTALGLIFVGGVTLFGQVSVAPTVIVAVGVALAAGYVARRTHRNGSGASTAPVPPPHSPEEPNGDGTTHPSLGR